MGSVAYEQEMLTSPTSKKNLLYITFR